MFMYEKQCVDEVAFVSWSTDPRQLIPMWFSASFLTEMYKLI